MQSVNPLTGLPIKHVDEYPSATHGNITPRTTHEQLTGCPRVARWLPVGCLWGVRGLSMECPWAVHRTSMGRPWNAHGPPVECRWASSGLPVVGRWACHEQPTDSPRAAHGQPTNSPRTAHGHSTGGPRAAHRQPTSITRAPHGRAARGLLYRQPADSPTLGRGQTMDIPWTVERPKDSLRTATVRQSKARRPTRTAHRLPRVPPMGSLWKGH